VFRENIKETMRDLDYIITPKTKSVAKDLDRVHEKLKKACSRKTLQELLNEEG
jgi:flagellar motility protein MotE (MotC chaperone)